MKMLLNGGLALSVFLFATMVHAKVYDGVKFAPETKWQGQNLKLIGDALEAVTIFEIDVFVAALYLKEKMTEAQIRKPGTTVEFKVHFVHEADSDTITKYFLEAFDNACTKDCAQLKPQLSTHLSKIPDINVGDLMSVQMHKEKVQLLYNNKLLGEFSGDDWKNTFVSFFIGKHAPSESFSNDMLGIQ